MANPDVIGDLAQVIHVDPEQVVGWDARNYVQDFHGTRFGGAMVVECMVRLGEETVTKSIRVDDDHKPFSPDTDAEAGRVALSRPTIVWKSVVQELLPTHF